MLQHSYTPWDDLPVHSVSSRGDTPTSACGHLCEIHPNKRVIRFVECASWFHRSFDTSSSVRAQLDNFATVLDHTDFTYDLELELQRELQKRQMGTGEDTDRDLT